MSTPVVFVVRSSGRVQMGDTVIDHQFFPRSSTKIKLMTMFGDVKLFKFNGLSTLHVTGAVLAL